ncbi:MAG: PAS domain S-box protein, partial [Methanoregulaceae archaeon]|nr:PAS domain S-box protein [Methanoregulaceae archaeon]
MISVLYVDDEPGLLEIAKLFLEKTGLFSVAIATSGQDALAMIASGQFDAVVSDYMMPGMNGIELLVRVRNEQPALPFIIFTGRGREEIAIEAFDKGADFYIQKGGEPKAQFVELTHKIQSSVHQREAERIIREGEERYRQIVETAQEGILTVDADERITYVNKKVTDIVGMSPEELLGRSVTDFIDPGEIEAHAAETGRRRQGKPGTYERRVRTPSGRDLWLMVSGTPLTARDGSYAGAFVMLSDITDKKQAMARLRTSELRYRQLFDALRSGVAIYEAVDGGRDFIIREINRAVEEIERVKREDVIGRRVTEVFPGIADFGLLYVFQRVWGSGEPEHPAVAQYRDGRIVGWRDNFVYRLPEGEVITVYDDVTAMKETVDALRESEQRFRALISNSSDIITILGPDGRILYDSPSSGRILGYPEGFLMAKYPAEFIHPDDQTRVLAELTKVYAGSSTGSPTEFRIRKEDGNYLPVESVAKNLIGIPGINGIVVTTRPIQERKDAERAIWEGEERYRRIVETAQEGILGIDAAGRISFINNKMAGMLELPQEEILGRPATDFICPDEAEAHESEIARRRKGEAGTYERRVRTARGGEVWARV